MRPRQKDSRLQGIRAVAFDCDGGMFDTARANRTYYNRVLAHFGRPPMTEEQFLYTHAHTGEEGIAYLFRETALTEAADAFRRAMGYTQFLPMMEIEPHLKALLNWLRPAYQTAVATNRMAMRTPK